MPTPPEGPLHPTDVTKSSCVLKWNPPRDDGGSEITHYIVEKMDADTSRWVPVGEPAGTQMRYCIIIITLVPFVYRLKKYYGSRENINGNTIFF